MKKIIEEIGKIVEKVADIPADEINADSAMIDDLDLASLEIMAIIAEIEQKYSIKISEDEMLSISTLQELAEIVQSKI